jgi:cytochrome c biogenesis protein CcmG/thiol:disulfide interchange protein DsbE
MKNLNPKLSYRIAVALGLFLVAGLGAYALVQYVPSERSGNAHGSAALDTTKAGYPAPDFALEQLHGEMFRLSEHRGKVVALNFWATWCPPCREEIPDLIKLQKEMKEDVLFVGISLDTKEEAVGPFAEEYGINYPVVIDDGRAVDKYGPISGIPMTFFIDQEGRVRLLAAGMVTEEQLRPVLTALTNGTVPQSIDPPFLRLDKPLSEQ